METETKTIELGGQLYEIRLVEPQPQPETKPTIPTLQDVFNKVQPKWCVIGSNIKLNTFENNCKQYYDQLSTERQCKRIQALIALQNIADFYNQEVDYRGYGYSLVSNRGEMYLTKGCNDDFLTPKFKSVEDADNAIEILRNANLLDNL